MRPVVFALWGALTVASPVVVAQVPDPPVDSGAPAIDTLPIRIVDFTRAQVPTARPEKGDPWVWAPHLKLKYGWASGHVESRFWYRIQDRRTDIRDARLLGADLSAGRWSVTAAVTRVSGRGDLRGLATTLNLAVANIGPVRPGIGARYSTSENATVLFSIDDMSIASSSQRELIAATLDVSVGRYDRSYALVQGLYGTAGLKDSLDLYSNGRVARSPLAIRYVSHADFWGVAATGVGRWYGFTLEGSGTCYVPLEDRSALPAREWELNVGGSWVVPVWLHLGGDTGLYAHATRVVHRRGPDRQSLHFLDDTLTFGLTIRIP